MDNYEDIIDLPHHVSDKRRPMSMLSRAAQFSPFAALTGYDEAVEETARLTDTLRELTETEIAGLNNALLLLEERESERPSVTVSYFLPDDRKSGGSYKEYSGDLRFFDTAERKLKFTDGTDIPIDNIYKIELL